MVGSTTSRGRTAGLTTVRQPLVDKGREAAQLLLDIIGGGAGREITLPTELVVRESAGPPPTDQ